ncbi:MAG TPA: M20/M25/M40 family metallo-hydrolase, partial [Desulfosarcina sp.]|nr:M20/M25/M40 family metallo-hydrolase [Desulfosarcina sp.]
MSRLVAINSGSTNKAGVDAVGRAIADALKDCGLSMEVVAETRVGDHLLMRTPCRADAAGQLLLVGHMDTVYPEDTGFTDYREDDTRALGPGVIDMKGGLVAAIYALKALFAVGLLQRIPLAFICNSDEEIGSPRSRSLIMREAGRSACALVLECGGPDGEVVTARKGNLSARLTVNGRAGHAAFAGRDKASAILEMAHKIVAIEALNDPSAGISANAGTVSGGIGP